MIAINDATREHGWTVRVSRKKTNDSVETRKSSSGGALDVATKTGKREAEFMATPHVYMHELANDFRVGSTILFLEVDECLADGRELFREILFELGVSAKRSVDSL